MNSTTFQSKNTMSYLYPNSNNLYQWLDTESVRNLDETYVSVITLNSDIYQSDVGDSEGINCGSDTAFDEKEYAKVRLWGIIGIPTNYFV